MSFTKPLPNDEFANKHYKPGVKTFTIITSKPLQDPDTGRYHSVEARIQLFIYPTGEVYARQIS